MAANGEATPLKGGGATTPHENSRGDSVVVHASGLSDYKFKFSWRKLASFMGPGWVMSLAYLDPGRRPPTAAATSSTSTSATAAATATAPSPALQQPTSTLAPRSRHPRANLARHPQPQPQAISRPTFSRALTPTCSWSGCSGGRRWQGWCCRSAAPGSALSQA